MGYRTSLGSSERDNGFTGKIVFFKKRIDRMRTQVPPNRIAEKYDIVIFHIERLPTQFGARILVGHFDRTPARLVIPIEIGRSIGLGRSNPVKPAIDRTGLTMGVPDPHTVGKDRLVDAAYAAAKFPLPVITVDLGTATTFNVVDEDRVFRGGVICPGLSTGLRALGERCAQLPQVRLGSPKSAIGVNTESCMLSGSVLGTAVLLDGIAQRIEEELGRPATLVVTGGLAKYVTPLCRHPLTYDPELLMKGLALLYQMNAPQHHAGGGKKRNQNFRRARRPHPQRRERREDEAKAG